MMGVVDTRELLGSAGDLVPKPTQDSKMVSTMHGGVHKQHPDPCFWLYDGPQMAKMCAEVSFSKVEAVVAMEASICSMGRCASSGCSRFAGERPMDFPRVGALVSHQYACGQDTGHVHHAAGERAHVQHSDRSRRFDKAHASPGATHGKTSRVSASMKRVDMFKIFLGEDEEKLDKIFSFQEG